MLMIDVFISHSSKDEKLAETLANLLHSAFSIRHERIRCTSVAPYKLKGGDDAGKQLCKEIREAKIFLALITPNTIQSPWMLIELGARWETQKHLTPLLAKGAKPGDIKGPFVLLNALRCDNPEEMEQLIHNVAEDLNEKIPQSAAYRKILNQLFIFSKPLPYSPSPELERAVRNLEAKNLVIR